jgi:cob(I)alamin adenosyltransferase
MPSVYTKSGDKGETTLRGAKKVPKDDLSIELIGELDELSSILGIVSSFDIPSEQIGELNAIQHNLYTLSSCLAGFIDFDAFINSERLEGWIDSYTKKLPELTDFILPSGTPGATHLYHARAVCRRAERRLVLLSKKEKRFKEYVPYINRLSDYLFELARYINHIAGVSEKKIKDIS